ncbi:MAG: hypothetical protein LBM69_09845 [Lachnospiraceae bacterium]|jgi:hypothetical protein|nr:hypothetical protein [Lachnospiraceae bacterium]
MKAMKKYLALTLAFVLTFAFCATALAAPVTDEGDVAPIEGTGNAMYIDTEIYSVVLPTGAAFNFAVDPLGLLNIESGDSMDLADLSGGLIVQTGEVAPFINNSSVAIDLSVAITATSTSVSANDIGDVSGGDDKDGNLSVTWRTAAPTVTDGVRGPVGDKMLDVLLYAQPASNDMGTWDDANEDGTIDQADTPEYAGADIAFALIAADADEGTDEAANLTFYLKPATWAVTNTDGVYNFDIEDDSVGQGSALQIGGWVDTEDDWESFKENGGTIGVNLVFSIKKATAAPSNSGEAVDADTDGFADGAFALTGASAQVLATAGKMVTPPAVAEEEPAAPAEPVVGWVEAEGATITDATNAAYTVSKSDDTTWTLPLELAGNTPTLVRHGASTTLIQGTDYTIIDDRIKFLQHRITNLGSNGTISYLITVDGTDYTLVINRTS